MAARLLGAFRLLSKPNALSQQGKPWKKHLSTSQALAYHMKYELRDDVAVITVDSPGLKVNTLSHDVMKEFKDVFDKFSNDPKAKSAVLISGKTENFIAGADISMLESCKNASDVFNISKNGQDMLRAVKNSPKPVVAAIMGSCLGGGLEVATACQYRIALKHKKTMLAVPEVLLGLLPGAGGTQMLQDLVSVPNAFDMMLTGRMIKAEKAKKMGLVDQLVDSIGPGVNTPEINSRNNLEAVAIRVAKGLVNGSVKRQPRQRNLKEKIMDFFLQYDFGKNYLIKQVRTRVMQQTHGNYPAPLRIIEVVKTSLDKGRDAGYEAEAHGFAELAMTKESKALIGLFRGQTACKKNRLPAAPKPVQNIAVLGAGLMGAGIGEVSIDKGMRVTMKDMTKLGLTKGQQQVEVNYIKGAKKKRHSNFEKDVFLSNLDAQLDYRNFTKQDMIIEAVFEDLSIKLKVLKEVEHYMPEHTIFASNTSAIPITQIAAGSKRPEKIIGMHYFSPVDKMQLLEIIKTPKTSEETISKAVDVGLKQGKTVIVVKDGPGFYTTRCIMALGMESAKLLREGLSPQDLNKQSLQAGFPVGLATLLDEVGVDVSYHVMKFLSQHLGPRFGFDEGAEAFVTEMVDRDFLGRKSGRGLFMYEGDGSTKKEINKEAFDMLEAAKIEPQVELSPEANRTRLLCRFTNEAVMCLQEGIIENPLDGDIGLVFGVGFPACLGGPFRYVDIQGASHVVSELENLAAAYGPTFEPCQLLKDYAKDSSKKFHK